MNLFKCACVVFYAILLCGCLESKGEFEAINAGKINAVYENGVLKIIESNTDFSQNFILFFFTTTCGVCKAQIPILQEIAQELENENIKIYGILGDAPNKDLAQKYAKESAISLPIFYENSARRFFSQIVGGVKGVPVIVIFKDGKVKEKFVGLIPKGKILSAL
ncbi:TlpA family protein disulfide reductase [Helicobacter sp. 23-1044]